MANRLNMARVEDILRLWQEGTSRRKIARLLGMDRATVSRHIERVLAGSSPGPAPLDDLGNRASNPATAPLGNPGQPSRCESFRSVIQQKVETHLTAQRIWQDLTFEHGFTGSYYSVRRFVRTLEKAHPELPFRRMECAPGKEVQVDFGKGAWVQRSSGRPRRPHVFRMVLSFSRKAYSEAVWRQDTETFLRCLENAFGSFGGVPKTVVVDNLKAAVLQADWYDPVMNPKLQAFCRHYGTVVLATRNPMSLQRFLGCSCPRNLHRKQSACVCQDPPRFTRVESDFGTERSPCLYLV
jgi:transposase